MKTKQTKSKIKRITDWAQLQLLRMEGVQIIGFNDTLEWHKRNDDQYEGLQVMCGHRSGGSISAIVQSGKSVYADTRGSDKQKCDLLVRNREKGFYFLNGVNTGLVRISRGGGSPGSIRRTYTRNPDEQMTNSDKFKLTSLVRAMEITLGRKLIKDKWFYEGGRR